MNRLLVIVSERYLGYRLVVIPIGMLDEPPNHNQNRQDQMKDIYFLQNIFFEPHLFLILYELL